VRRVLEHPLIAHLLCAAALVACTLLAYSNSFDAQFVYDDFQNFVDNPRVHWYELRPEAIRDGLLGGPTRRPVAIFSFGLNFYFGDLDVWGYHVFNFAVHVLTSVAVYALLFATLQLPGARRRDAPPPTRRSLIACSLLGALIFALHPLQTQAVTYVVQRMTAMAAGFYLAAFLVYVHAVRETTGLRRWLGWSALAALYLLGLGSKEIAAPLPFALWLYEWCFGQRLDAAWARRRIVWLLPPLIVAVAGFAWIYDALQLEFGRRDFSMSERALTQLRVVFFYASLVLLPLPSRQNLLHLTATSHSLFDPITTALALLSLIALLGFVVWLAPRRPLSAFGILWFFLHLIVESSLLPLEMIYEHRTYLPMFAVSLIVADGLRAFPSRHSTAAFASVASLAIVLGFLTHARNEVWREPADLWADVYRKTGDARARKSVAWAVEGRGLRLAADGRDRDALVYFRQAAQIAPEYARNYRSWGDSLIGLGRTLPAVGRYEKAISLEPDRWGAYNQLAFALAQLDRMPRAVVVYLKVMQRTDDAANLLPTPRRLVERGYSPRAIVLLETALATRPKSSMLRRELYDVLLGAGEYAAAVEHAMWLLEREPDATLHGQLGLVFWELGRTSPALEQMEAARALAPDDARHAANLAWMLATAPEPGLRDAKRALELIEPLIAASDPDPDLLDTAAAALSALGRWEEAIERIELALELARLADSWAVEDLELRRTALRNRQPVVDQIAAARAAAEAR
jgi:tetratricopeptide (TPR) repeat protein